MDPYKTLTPAEFHAAHTDSQRTVQSHPNPPQYVCSGCRRMELDCIPDDKSLKCHKCKSRAIACTWLIEIQREYVLSQTNISFEHYNNLYLHEKKVDPLTGARYPIPLPPSLIDFYRDAYDRSKPTHPRYNDPPVPHPKDNQVYSKPGPPPNLPPSSGSVPRVHATFAGPSVQPPPGPPSAQVGAPTKQTPAKPLNAPRKHKPVRKHIRKLPSPSPETTSQSTSTSRPNRAYVSLPPKKTRSPASTRNTSRRPSPASHPLGPNPLTMPSTPLTAENLARLQNRSVAAFNPVVNAASNVQFDPTSADLGNPSRRPPFSHHSSRSSPSQASSDAGTTSSVLSHLARIDEENNRIRAQITLETRFTSESIKHSIDETKRQAHQMQNEVMLANTISPQMRLETVTSFSQQHLLQLSGTTNIALQASSFPDVMEHFTDHLRQSLHASAAKLNGLVYNMAV